MQLIDHQRFCLEHANRAFDEAITLWQNGLRGQARERMRRADRAYEKYMEYTKRLDGVRLHKG